MVRRPDIWLGAAVLLLGAVVVFAWAPLDSETGLIEKIRRRRVIGDALAPTLAGALLMAAGAWVALAGALRREAEPAASLLASLGHMAALLGLFIAAFFIMRWAGPTASALFGEGFEAYRPLRDTIPWKYLGYILGGAALVAALIAYMERRLTVQAVVIGLVAATALALLYDLPFDDLLLPPNGDL